MEEREVSAMLAELPATKYGEFLAKWPDIKATLERGVQQKAIYQTLTTAGSLTLSYVSFTRYVKKAMSEASHGDVPPPVGTNVVRSGKERRVEEIAAKENGPAESELPQVETQDKSATIATSAADALKDAKATSSRKNYANNIRRRG